MKAATEVPVVNQTAPRAAVVSAPATEVWHCPGCQPHGGSLSRRTLRRSRVRSVPLHPGSAGGSRAAAAGKRVPSCSSACGGAERNKTARMLRRATRRSSCQSGVGACGSGSRWPWQLAGRGRDGGNGRAINNNCVKTKMKEPCPKGSMCVCS